MNDMGQINSLVCCRLRSVAFNNEYFNKALVDFKDRIMRGKCYINIHHQLIGRNSENLRETIIYSFINHCRFVI